MASSGMISRRAVLHGTAALLAAPPLIGRADEPLRVAIAATDSSILFPVAVANGYLARVGLSADIQFLANGAATVAALAGGSLDVGGSNSLSFLQARDRGLPLKMLAAQSVYRTGAASTLLVVPKDSPLRDGRDLTGKVVAVNAIGGSPHIAVEAWIDQSGGDAKAVKYLEMTFPAMPAALQAGRVDAAMIAEPALTASLETGRVLGDAYGAIGPLWIADGIIATESWLAANADTARRVAIALRQAAIWANHNHDKTAEISAQLLKIDPAVVRSMRRAVFAETVAPQMLEPVIAAGVTYGALSHRSPASDAISPAALS